MKTLMYLKSMTGHFKKHISGKKSIVRYFYLKTDELVIYI